MINTKTIQTKSEIIDALLDSFEQVRNCVQTTDEDFFYQQKNKKWSVAENFDHLIRSNIPIASVLKRNKLSFLPLGISLNGSSDYESLQVNYLLKLKTNPVPLGAYSPSKKQQTSKQDLLNNWGKIETKFAPRIKTWSDMQLDRLRLPHPLLGKLTFREMLFFTIYHNHHHLTAMKVAKGEI